ncbi:DNA polymerase [Novosphingobium barchaimii LL02]|uniref:DNA polymerase I n=1 Tax=Novosphingobium barchaimii LL02 TaxID=1114963 RepID=A0A0J7XKS6_9SPHN|nr:DNA polymerase I [Novosphingobium barchaimii]KMS52596.1 DNA polymerase [Novosphingobium barchaimii LL02]
MDSKQHLYLVDGSAYIFRAYHRLPPLTNPEGTPVGAVYGYTTMLWKLAEDLNKADGPTHLAVILDASSKSFRNDIYADYKANRPPPPEDLVPQFPLIRDATRAFSLPCIEELGYEADDLIASYARAATAQGWDVTIVSSDKDLMQLVGKCGIGGGCVDMLDTMKNQRIDIPEVLEKFGVAPDKVGDVLALMGDAVDNVPGVYGVGPKTATKLIQDYGDLESALAAAPAMKKSKLQERLIEQAEQARLSKVLVTLKEDCALPMALDDFKLVAIPPEPLAAFLGFHGFTSLLKRLDLGSGSPERATQLNPAKAVAAGAKADAGGGAGIAGASRQALPEWPAVDRSAYECVTTVAQLDEWIARAAAARLVAVDTETSALDAMRADLAGISLAVGANQACYIPLGHGGTDMFAEKPEQVPLAEALARLKPLLESDAVLKVGQNIKYDLNVLARHGIEVSPVDDTMIVSFCLDAGRSLDGIGGGHGMDELSQRHLAHTTLTFKEICGTGKKAIPFGEVPLDRATQYAAEDADVTWRLHSALKPRLSFEGGTRIYERVDRPLIPVVAQMERHGIKVDREKLAGLSSQFAEAIGALEKEIFAKVGQEFTIGSPKQLGDILFDKLGYKGGKKGKSGQYSTDQSILEGLAGQGAEVATQVLEWRQLSKLRSTYTEALQAAINPATQRVHTSYSLVGAQTGRLSSTDPNLQNIPIRTEIGRQIRDCFVADTGNVLLSADYSQIELRLAAHMADVPSLKEAFANGEDIHSRTAMEMFGVVDRDTRGRAKTINFAILYGISRWGLAGRLGVPADEAQAMIDRYFERFPGIQRYIHETLESVRLNGYSETLFGRKTWFPRVNSKNQAERQGSERAAINAPIQGTSADIIKRAMVRMNPALAAAGLGHVRMLLQVHDELVFELPEGDVAEAKPVIERVMAEAAAPAVNLDVPLGVEIGFGTSWGAAH